jgi:hypothetical protein
VEEDRDPRISRRHALRRAAVVGGAVWVAPAIQSLHLPSARAATGSAPPEDRRCYSVAIDIDHYGNVGFHTGDRRWRCLTPATLEGATGLVAVASDGAGGYVVSARTNGGVVAEGRAEWKDGGGRVVGDPCGPGTGGGTNAMRFVPPTTAAGKPAKRVDIELTVCVARTNGGTA